MKKIILLLSSLFITILLHSEDNPLSISSQNLEIHYYSESEYNKTISIGSDFSSGFDILSETDNVSIIVNGKTYLTERLLLSSMSSGLYLIIVKKSGYNTVKRWIELENGKRVVIKVTLARKFGYLNIESNSTNFELFLNNRPIKNNQAIPSGTFSLTVKAFGFTEEKRSVYIYDKMTTNEVFHLETAPFKIEVLSSDKSIYNPYANEGFGQNRIKIRVNGPGSGYLTINNSQNKSLLSHELKFETWDTYFKIEGLLPDGLHRVNIDAEGESRSITIEVDSSLYHHNIPLHRGFPGLVASPTGEMNRAPISNTSFSIETTPNSSLINFPFSYQITPINHLKIRGGMVFAIDFKNKYSHVELFTGVQTMYSFKPLNIALNINYSFSATQDKITNNPMKHYIILNLPLTLGFSNMYISLAPEYSYSFNKNSAGCGAGIHFDNQRYRVGLSGRFDMDNDENVEYLYGVEGYMIIPGTQSYSGIVISGNRELELSIMLSFSILY